MNKLSKNIFYGITIGLSLIVTIAIYFASKTKVGKPINLGLILMYVLIVLSLIAALALAVRGLINNPKSALMAGGGVVVLLIFVVIGYFIDDHEIKPSYIEYNVTSPGYSGIIGGSLIATWIVLGLSLLITAYAAVTDFIKKM